MTTRSFEEILNAGGHKDATFHIGGHGEGGADVKVIVITNDQGETFVCVRRDGVESVTPVEGKDAGLQAFAGELQTTLEERSRLRV
jgi:hypothetical protein